MDFQQASDFVHGQHITSKVIPFTFYQSIYSKFVVMMTYIFRTIRLFAIPEELDNDINQLEGELVRLGDDLFKKKR